MKHEHTKTMNPCLPLAALAALLLSGCYSPHAGEPIPPDDRWVEYAIFMIPNRDFAAVTSHANYSYDFAPDGRSAVTQRLFAAVEAGTIRPVVQGAVPVSGQSGAETVHHEPPEGIALGALTLLSVHGSIQADSAGSEKPVTARNRLHIRYRNRSEPRHKTNTLHWTGRDIPLSAAADHELVRLARSPNEAIYSIVRLTQRPGV